MTSQTIIISGMLAGDPFQGGATWAVLQYVFGLTRLGHRVILIEPFQNESTETGTLASSPAGRYFQQVLNEHQLEGNAALLVAGTRSTIGLPYDRLCGLADEASLLINISGMLKDSEILSRIPIRLFLDLDPGFVQLWHAAENIDMGFDDHTHFATVGQAVGSTSCTIPTCGKEWFPSLPPVVLDQWPKVDQISISGLSTITNWRGYGSIEHDGLFFGQKAHSLRARAPLPRHVLEPVSLALTIHPDETKDLAMLKENNWQLLDPMKCAGTPGRYRNFVQHSKAEIGVAKSGYVVSRSGWFSDRSACYLASGKPVVAQDTGISTYLPTGEGLLTFSTLGEAVEQVGKVSADYSAHSEAARALAEEHLDSDKVLRRLLAYLEVGT